MHWSLCAWGREKNKENRRKQRDLITFSTVAILQPTAPKLRPIAIPTPLTDHPLNFTACCCISHHQHGCTKLQLFNEWSMPVLHMVNTGEFSPGRNVYTSKQNGRWEYMMSEHSLCWRNCRPKIYWIIYSPRVVVRLQKPP